MATVLKHLRGSVRMVERDEVASGFFHSFRYMTYVALQTLALTSQVITSLQLFISNLLVNSQLHC